MEATKNEALKPKKSAIEKKLEGKKVIVVGGRNTGKTAALKAMKENKVTLDKNPNAEYPKAEPTTVEIPAIPEPKKNVQDIIKDMRDAAAAKWKKMTPEQKAEVRAEREAIRIHNKALRNGTKSYARTKGFKPVPSMLSIDNYSRRNGTHKNIIIM